MSGEGVHNPADLTAVEASLVVIDNEIEALQEDVDAIQAIVEAEAILEETGGILTTDGTLQNVYINNAPGGVYEPRWFNINFTNQTVTETVVIRTYYRNVDGGAWVQDDSQAFVGVPVNLLISVELKPNRYGCRVTVEKTAGTNRTYVWEVFYEV
ncbi:hypothetical protein LCGC14_1793640 [marine sediment metagenome]|uniref:Uncharacterized protein n=1 Tax=marine sediment metagenome TaxID=412755 RepID=A0A0F9JRC1_9ZZZZ